MKNLYIHGHFINDNYGDFLLYYAIEKILEKYENKYNWYSSNVDESYDKYCKVYRKEKKEAINTCDLAIFTGGGYFAKPIVHTYKWDIKCLIRHILPAYRIYKRKMPYIIVGVEVGPMSLFLNKYLLKKIFNGAKKVSVRNEESKKFLKKIKVKNKIEVNPDWIMSMDEKDFQNSDIDDFIYKKNKKNIFVHISSSINETGVKYVINDLIKYQSEHENIRYIFGCDQDKTIQKERVKLIYDKFNNNDNKLLNYKNPWYLTEVLKNVDAVITNKLHVGIVSTIFKKEVICVAKDSKTIRFYNQIGRSEYAILLKDVKENQTLKMMENLKFKKINIDQSIFDNAKNNKKIVEEFLSKN